LHPLVVDVVQANHAAHLHVRMGVIIEARH
jgi:hypothetical protein